MFKREYFLWAMKHGLYQHKRWILEAFALFRPGKAHDYPYGLFIAPDGRYAIHDKESDTGYTIIEDAMPGEPLFRPLEKLLLKPGDLANVRSPVVTCYGTALVNQLVLVYAFGSKIEYVPESFKIGPIEKIIQERWDDNGPEPTDSESAFTAPIRTSEYHRYNEAVGQLPGLTQLCVPSATRKTMTADPAMIKRRDELLEQHKERLHDPVVLAEILDELTKMDRAWMKGDPGERFYIKDKSYDIVRLKVFIMQGISTGFGVAADLIKSSLDEGWNIAQLPAMINQLRAGSFGRGAQTALGGVEVKFNNRIFQNSTITETDCGTKRSLPVFMTKLILPHYIGNYQIKDGVTSVMDAATLETLVGQVVFVRTPGYCKTSGANFCVACVGDRVASTPQALGTYAATIGSLLMDVFMKLMHGKSLKTEVLEYDNWLS